MKVKKLTEIRETGVNQMFILRKKQQLERAIEKAKKIRPKVHFVNFGHYQVSGSKGYYTVICKKSDN